MLEERVIRCRSAKRFEERYLRKGFDEQISVIRILDSRREEFRLSTWQALSISVYGDWRQQHMKENWVYRRGDLYLANLGVPVGSKQGGVRPVVVLQNDVGNYYAPTITIAPLTSKIEKKRKQPTHFFLRKAKGLAKPSMVE